MPSTPLPPEFEKSRPAKPNELHDLPGPSHEAAYTLERCIAVHHVAEVDYTCGRAPEHDHHQPAYFRFNSTDHVVLWGIPTNADNWEELRMDRILAARDTGEEFTHTW